MIVVLALAAIAGTHASPDSQAIEGFTPEQSFYIRNEMERIARIRKLTTEQALIVYDQCLARAGAALSHTDLADDAVFSQARLQCGALRADLLAGSPSERFLEFNKLDEAKAAAFPALTRKIRDPERSAPTQQGTEP